MQSKILEQIRNGLRSHYGSMNEVAAKAGVCRDMVRMVLKGERKNEKVVKIAAQVLLERESKASENRKAIQRTVERAMALAS